MRMGHSQFWLRKSPSSQDQRAIATKLIAHQSACGFCSIAPLFTTVLVAPSGFHGADQDEETENGSQLGEGLDGRWHTVAKGATGERREHQDGKGSPNEHRLTSTVSELF